MDQSQSNSPIQFKLRTLLVATFVSAIVIINWPLIAEYLFSNFHVLVLALLGLGWFGGRLRALRHAKPTVGTYRRWMTRLFFPITVCLCLFSLWSRHRWLESFRSREWPLGFPYPDNLLLSFRDWLATRDSAPPGIFRIEGEANTVLGYLEPITISLCILVGIMCGVLWPRPIHFWKRKLARRL